jgi:hypothetical protein
MKYLKYYEKQNMNKCDPDYYTDEYNNSDKDEFMFWYYKIFSFLIVNDEYGALEEMLNYENETHTFIKADLYSLIRWWFRYTPEEKIINKYNL